MCSSWHWQCVQPNQISSFLTVKLLKETIVVVGVIYHHLCFCKCLVWWVCFCFDLFFFVICSSSPPWSLPSLWTSSSVFITAKQENFPTQVSSTSDASRPKWETNFMYLSLILFLVESKISIFSLQTMGYNLYEIPLFIAMGAVGKIRFYIFF